MGSYVKRYQRERSNFLKQKRGLSCPSVPAIAHVKVVTLDEISMIDGLLLETLDAVARFWWPEQMDRPFEVLVMVFVGDFQQLPPVGSGT